MAGCGGMELGCWMSDFREPIFGEKEVEVRVGSEDRGRLPEYWRI